MAASRGGADVKRFMADVPTKLATKVLRGAARAAATVVADDAKRRSISSLVAEAIVVKTKADVGRIVVKISVKAGWARSVGIWQEYGTDPHFISVDDDQREGRSVARINSDEERKGSLLINGKPVGRTVYHPGAAAHPFLRVALDDKQVEAIAAAQSYINVRVKPSGIVATDEPEGDDA